VVYVRGVVRVEEKEEIGGKRPDDGEGHAPGALVPIVVIARRRCRRKNCKDGCIYNKNRGDERSTKAGAEYVEHSGASIVKRRLGAQQKRLASQLAPAVHWEGVEHLPSRGHGEISL
jgi:hypothetical protein